MCGIYGYIGNKNAAHSVQIGLKNLDYRGYDSWGIGIFNNVKILIDKHAGKISEAENNLPNANIAIGHTRWATHGAVSDLNAHPHFSSDKSFILCQNGIVENYTELKKALLKKNYRFISQTDTEIIVRQIEEESKRTSSFLDAVKIAFQKLQGRNTIIILRNNGQIICLRNGSPLVIGATPDLKEIFISSDTLSFANFTKKMLVLDNGQMAICEKEKINLYNVVSNKKVPLQFEKIDITDNKAEKEGYPHFMIKEINDSPYVIKQICNQETKPLNKLAQAVKKADHVYTIGSGTAGVAAAQIAYYLRVFGHIPAVNLIGAEAKDYLDLFTKKDLLIAPSQSGETADVLEILEIAKKNGVQIASFVNMPGSMMTRISDYKFMAQAGPEICVMSTKIFVSQLAWGYLLAKTVNNENSSGKENLQNLAKVIQKYLQDKKTANQIIPIAKHLITKPHIFLLAKAQNLQIIKEGMIKIIEGTYLHAHAVPAGDLKHYIITLMEKGIPVITVLSNDEAQKDVINAINQIKTRGAEIIGIANQKNTDFDFYLPVPEVGEASAIMNVIPLQLLAYYMALNLGNNIDKPRNIAKSVTVK